MILVKRPKTIPESLKGRKSPGGIERASAIQHFAKKNNWKKPFLFSAYKAPDVIDALMKLFFNKCAYCESILATQPPDLEHYRPKGGVLVNGKLEVPGYYWLAAEWTNLLPSCIDCNRVRNYRAKKQKAGKGNNFPLSDAKRRWRNPKQRNREVPLLIDPCRQDPQNHLIFDLSARGSVRPINKRNAPDPHGQATIDVFGLNRPPLAQARRVQLKQIEFQLSRLQDAHVQVQQNPRNKHAREELKLYFDHLRGLIRDPERGYLAMLGQILEPHLRRAAKTLKALPRL